MNLLIRKTRSLGGHAVIGILRGDHLEEIAFIGISGNGDFAAFSTCEKFGPGIHRKPALFLSFGVALSTIFFEHRHDLVHKVNFSK
jgi:hypothetical protein